jgi:hypothetical protein
LRKVSSISSPDAAISNQETKKGTWMDHAMELISAAAAAADGVFRRERERERRVYLLLVEGDAHARHLLGRPLVDVPEQ